MAPLLPLGQDPAAVERARTDGRRQPLNVAHRGASKEAPENTLPAFERAIALGASGIEADVRLTADGHAVVLHDTTLDRTTTGNGRLRGVSLEDLDGLDAGGGAAVPTVREVLELAHGRVGVFLEIKDFAAVPATLEAISATGMERDVAIMAFSQRTLQRAEALGPDLARVRLTRNRADTALSLRGNEGAALGARHRLLDRRLVQRCHRQGRAVLAWTADDEQDLRRLVNWGADAIVTNRPDRLASLLSEAGERP
jgi:glycerophosphoryl diester phosphodiesterase